MSSPSPAGGRGRGRDRGRDPVHARAGHPPGLHRRAGGGRPGRDARCHGRSRRRPRPGEPARPGRPGHRPLGPGRRLRDAGGVRVQRRARIRAQRRALPAAALGPGRVPRPAGRAAGDRHRPPGQPRVPGHGRDQPGRRARAGRLPGHAGRDRLAHDDDQRPGRPGLWRRRDRGRGGPPRPAGLPADAAGGRGPPPQRAAQGLDRDRPGPGRDRAAARVRRGRRLRRVRRRRAGRARPRRSGDDLEHEPRVRGDRDAVPDRRRDPDVPAPDRPVRRAGRPRRALRPGPGAVARARRPRRPSTTCSSSTWRPSRRRWPARAGPRTGFRWAISPTSVGVPPLGDLPDNFRTSFPQTTAGDEDDPGRGADGRRGRPDRWTRGHDRHRGRRAIDDDPLGLGRDRRHHLVHQHVEPDGDGRRRPARPERRRPRADRGPDGQDLARARLQGGHRLSRDRRPDGPLEPSGSPWPAMAARPASATPARSTSRSPRRSRRTTWWSRRSSRATATSRAGSIPWPGRATSPRRRWSWPSPWPAGSTST